MFDEVLELLKDTLNGAFSRDTDRKRIRKIIFWYDSKQEYQEFINELKLENTEIIQYDNNSFWIRYHIEKEEIKKNIIIYLPFERKKGIDNDLLDLETSNSDLLFNPDSTTMLLKELGLTEECRKIIKEYSRFFNNKIRLNEFKEFDVEEKNADNIDYIITAILLDVKTINIDEILKNIIRVYYEDKKKYDALLKFGNEKFIFDMINNYFGSRLLYSEDMDNMFKSLIFTYFATSVLDVNKLNKYGLYILSEKTTNVQVFVNNLMRDKSLKKYFEKISNDVYEKLGIKELLSEMDLDDYKEADAFSIIDDNIISYLTKQLFNDVKEYEKYNDLITLREGKYWYEKYYNEYSFLKYVNNYFKIIEKALKSIKTLEIEKFIELYANELYLVDYYYRKIYYHYDNINDKDIFASLKDKVENNYINSYMFELSQKWSDSIENLSRYDSNKLIMQNKFFDKYIKSTAESAKNGRSIVIISDAFRYECAKELNERLQIFGSKSETKYMLGLVPSYTQLGMASLLPNKELSRDQNYKEKGSENIFVDGISSAGTENREKILKKYVPDGLAIQYETLNAMTKTEWKKLFSGKKVVYIYHDVIDNTGEHDENSVFEACEKAIDQIEKLVKDLHTTFSGVNCYIVADHGFFYKRGKIEEFNKTAKDENSIKQKTRYSYTDNKSEEEGIISINLDYIFGKDSGYVNIPKGHNVFSRQGGGINYIHGGILPQEIIIPVIDFNSSRSSEETKKVGITYTGLTRKITNAVTYLEFLQDNNIDENNLPCRYSLHFEDENGNKISDESTIIANYTNIEVKDRFFKEKFVFKNIKYNKDQNYFLVISDEETGEEKQKIGFVIDIAVVDSFIL